MTVSNKKFHIKRDQLNLAINDFFSKGSRIKNVNSFKSGKGKKVSPITDDNEYYMDNPYYEISDFEPMSKTQRNVDFE